MGKAKKHRECPAVGRQIPAPECGEKRGTDYDCPPHCPYCPWAISNYDELLRIEQRVDQKALRFYLETVGRRRSRACHSIRLCDGLRPFEEIDSRMRVG